MSEYKPSLIVFPHRILYLEGLQLSYLKVYEIIFHLWHAGKQCFISNPILMERTGLSRTTVKEALAFFEEKGEMRRIHKGRKRYLLPPINAIEIENENESVDNLDKNGSNSGQGAANSAIGGRQVGHLGAANSAHNITNINNTNLSKSFCNKKDQKENNSKKHSFAAMKNESASIKQNEILKKTGSPSILKEIIKGLPCLKLP